MCNTNGVLFGALNISRKEIMDKEVIEVGSMNVNGTLRRLVESHNPKKYLGVDLFKGPGVDKICNAEYLLDYLGSETFDVLISTEMLEHVRNWRKVVNNFKNLIRPGGIMIITTRSIGFPYHAYPYDFWRFEAEDVKAIFSDCIIRNVERDSEIGIFAKIEKPRNFVQNNLSNYKLYSVIQRERITELKDEELKDFLRHKEAERKIAQISAKIIPFRILKTLSQIA